MATMLAVITVLSLALAATMTAVAWRLIRDDRRRSAARVAALAAVIDGDADIAAGRLRTAADGVESGVRPEPAGRNTGVGRATSAPRAVLNDLPMRETPAIPLNPDVAGSDRVGSNLFAGAPPDASRSRLAAVVLTGVFVVASGVALAVLWSGTDSVGANAGIPAAPDSSRTPAPTVSSRASGPLELVALGHERDGERLIVRGIVRNPASGADAANLTAVVFLFNHDGGFVSSGRAAVAAPALAPGGEAPFIVTIPDAAEVGRYRVSFRNDAAVVPHVDKRGEKR